MVCAGQEVEVGRPRWVIGPLPLANEIGLRLSGRLAGRGDAAVAKSDPFLAEVLERPRAAVAEVAGQPHRREEHATEGILFAVPHAAQPVDVGRPRVRRPGQEDGTVAVRHHARRQRLGRRDRAFVAHQAAMGEDEDLQGLAILEAIRVALELPDDDVDGRLRLSPRHLAGPVELAKPA